MNVDAYMHVYVCICICTCKYTCMYIERETELKNKIIQREEFNEPSSGLGRVVSNEVKSTMDF